ncbi:hypothetical protein PHYSODRAFT_322723 [Phytophthora sojae]|uniref:Uncharacterized protein n=1 Tax=Phytophthora sojae (strain P6497) TaxID=1094619 RepID=G4YJ41_PHYSP|nr:hypothetical protein PHYSODRAFT_322723 [Phytophthora sojae]EGZ29181.1 hypothetical protein PHYSODRAFT_322723 [Phytophthora sojae]|eukprot:XP_009516456.1 hypothetical protein PHYSODRAFT_322723 [Phytophthora sojae]
MNSVHPANGAELAKALKLLGLLKTVKEDPQRVALIFVVLKENIQSFGPQEISLDALNGEDNVDKLHQMGNRSRKSLREFGIATIGDLRTLLATEEAKDTNAVVKLSFATLRRRLTTHDENQQWSVCSTPFRSLYGGLSWTPSTCVAVIPTH